LSPQGKIKKILRSKYLIFLGTISYTVYMSHEFVLWIISNIIKRILHRPEIQGAHGEWIVSLTKTETFTAVIFLLIAIIIISTAIYRCIEQPMREKSRRMALRI
jgi:peptidoglycan/LPS O-acetylase OafA/YrhL